MDGLLEDLSVQECTRLLRAGSIGRIAVIERGFPIVVPVNYRFLEASGQSLLIVRTRSGTVLDRASSHIAFEVDGIDRMHRQGWTVLVRGTLQRVNPKVLDLGARFDPGPWVASATDVWLLIKPLSITGRQLRPPEFQSELDPIWSPLPSGPAQNEKRVTVTRPRLTPLGDVARVHGSDLRLVRTSTQPFSTGVGSDLSSPGRVPNGRDPIVTQRAVRTAR